MVDPTQYQLRVHRLQALGISTIATCHSPTITGANVARAFDLLRAVPSAPVVPLPGQAVLDEIIASLVASVA